RFPERFHRAQRTGAWRADADQSRVVCAGETGGDRRAAGRNLALREMEGDVHDGFEVDRFAVAFGRAEFPLRESAHGVRVELRIDSFHQLDRVDRTVATNHRIEDDLAFDVLRHGVRRIFGIDLAQWRRFRDLAALRAGRAGWRAAHFREIQN